MSYNGSGTFNINSTGQPVVSGTVISSSAFNALTADLATGLSTAITKDGQTTITNNIPFNSYRITNLGAGVAGSDAARLSQVQAGSASVVTVTGTDTYVGTMSPALAGYSAGNVFSFVVPNTNTTACTLNIDGLGAKAITRDGSTALIAGDLVAGKEVLVAYDGTRFQVLNSNSMTNLTVSGTATLSGGTANGVAYLNGSKVLTTGSGLTYNSTGNMTIAAPSSGTALSVNGLAGQRIASFQGASGSDAYISINAFGSASQWWINNKTGSGDLDFYEATLGATRMTIGYAGNVIINAPASGNTLTVNGINGQSAIYAAGAAGISAVISAYGNGGAGGTQIIGGSDNNSYIQATNSLYVSTNGVSRLSIGTAGNVTINAPTSGFALAVSGQSKIDSSGSDEVLQLRATSSPYVSFYQAGTLSGYIQASGSNFYLVQSSAGTMYFNTGGNNRISIGNTGNVTINAPASSGHQINGAASGTLLDVGDGTRTFRFTTSGGNPAFGTLTANNLGLLTDGTVKATIDTSGNLGLGTAPNAWSSGFRAIQISGQGVSVFGQTGASVVGIGSNGYYNGTNWIYNNSANAGLYQINGAAHEWYTAPSGTAGNAITFTQRMGISSTGNVTINAPTSGQALEMTGTAAGTAALTINTSATTGAQTATFVATNKPGTGTTTPTKWLPIVLDGTTYYIPCWT